MDKFVIKLHKPEIHTRPPPSLDYKQMKLESLQGVVIIEDVKKAKTILLSKSTSDRKKLGYLEKLAVKRPCKEVLESTGIDDAVKSLIKSENSKVAKLAENIFNSWKKYHENKENRTLIDVKCDLKTEQLRSKGRTLLAEALHNNTNNSASEEEIGESIEKEVYSKCKKKVLNSYRRTIRKLVFTLRHQSNVRDSVLINELSVSDLVRKYYQT